MKYLKLLPLMLLVAFILPSCIDDNDNSSSTTETLSISSTYNYIASVDIADNSLQVLPGANIGLVVDKSNVTIQLYISDLQYDANSRAVSFNTPELQMSTTTSGWSLEQSEAMTLTTSSNSTVNISNLKVKFNQRSTGSQNLVILSFTVDGRYQVSTYFTPTQYIGTTTSVDVDAPTVGVFTSETPQYLVVLDRTNMKAQVQVANAKFLDGMPSLGTMVFDEIPLTFTKTGYTFTTDSVIPSISDVPYPAFTLTNLSGSVEAGKTLKLKFTCAKYNREVTVEGTVY
jgi:hypothetical protein